MALALALLLAFLPASPAAAADVSWSTWTVGAADVTLRVSLPGVPSAALARSVARHVDVHAGSAACPAIDQGQDVGFIDTLAPRPGRAEYEIMFRCPVGGALRLDNHVGVDAGSGHFDLATIQAPGQPDRLALFDAGHQSVLVPADRVVAAAPLGRFVGLGFTQTLGGVEALAFVAALLLGLRRRGDAVAASVGLLAGYAVAVALTVSGVALVRPELARAVTGLWLLLLAVGAGLAHAGPGADSGRWRGRVGVALACGLLVLATVALARGQMHGAWLLAGAAVVAPSYLAADRIGGPGWAVQAVRFGLPALMVALMEGAGFAGAIAGLDAPLTAAAPVVGRDLGALAAALLAGGTLAGGVWLIGRGGRRGAVGLLAEAAGGTLAAVGAIWLLGALHA